MHSNEICIFLFKISHEDEYVINIAQCTYMCLTCRPNFSTRVLLPFLDQQINVYKFRMRIAPPDHIRHICRPTKKLAKFLIFCKCDKYLAIPYCGDVDTLGKYSIPCVMLNYFQICLIFKFHLYFKYIQEKLLCTTLYVYLSRKAQVEVESSLNP